MNYRIIVTLGEDELKDFNNPSIMEADILEIRLDLVSISFMKDTLQNVLRHLAKPILFTYRNPKDSSETSNNKLSVQDIEQLLTEFNLESNFLDMELDQEKSIFDSIQKCKYTTIYSYHDFTCSIRKEEMLKWISKKNSMHCIYKFAVTPSNFKELEIFLEDLSFISKTYTVIGIAMGEIGIYSRIFGDRFGSFATYCCMGKARAPGQINVLTLKKIREDYRKKVLPKIEDTFYKRYV